MLDRAVSSELGDVGLLRDPVLDKMEDGRVEMLRTDVDEDGSEEEDGSNQLFLSIFGDDVRNMEPRKPLELFRLDVGLDGEGDRDSTDGRELGLPLGVTISSKTSSSSGVY